MSASGTDTDRMSVVHDALASANRRQILRYLAAQGDDGATVDELVDELIDHDETEDDRQRIATTLHHVELPKLADGGFIEYDARTLTAHTQEQPTTGMQDVLARMENA